MALVDKNLSSSLILDKLYGSNSTDPPSHVLEFDDVVVLLEFSPYLWSQDLLCIAFPSKIIVASVKFKEENNEQIEPLKFDVVKKYTCYGRIQAITWSPETNINIAPKTILFAVSTNTFEINIYSSDDTYIHKINAHRNYVNDISFSPSGDYLASVSDDLTCRIWSVKNGYREERKFYVDSPPITAKWHKDDPGKLLVAEIFGIVKIYNILAGTTVVSFRSKVSPLISLEWCPKNSEHIVAMCGGNLVRWNITTPSIPTYDKLVHPDGGVFAKFAPFSEQTIVTLGTPDFSLKVLHEKEPFPKTIATMKSASSLTVHQHLPYVCVGVKKNIYMWLIN